MIYPQLNPKMLPMPPRPVPGFIPIEPKPK
jgi:hypothetical protein